MAGMLWPWIPVVVLSARSGAAAPRHPSSWSEKIIDALQADWKVPGARPAVSTLAAEEPDSKICTEEDVKFAPIKVQFDLTCSAYNDKSCCKDSSLTFIGGILGAFKPTASPSCMNLVRTVLCAHRCRPCAQPRHICLEALKDLCSACSSVSWAVGGKTKTFADHFDCLPEDESSITPAYEASGQFTNKTNDPSCIGTNPWDEECGTPSTDDDVLAGDEVFEKKLQSCLVPDVEKPLPNSKGILTMNQDFEEVCDGYFKSDTCFVFQTQLTREIAALLGVAERRVAVLDIRGSTNGSTVAVIEVIAADDGVGASHAVNKILAMARGGNATSNLLSTINPKKTFAKVKNETEPTATEMPTVGVLALGQAFEDICAGTYHSAACLAFQTQFVIEVADALNVSQSRVIISDVHPSTDGTIVVTLELMPAPTGPDTRTAITHLIEAMKEGRLSRWSHLREMNVKKSFVKPVAAPVQLEGEFKGVVALAVDFESPEVCAGSKMSPVCDIFAANFSAEFASATGVESSRIHIMDMRALPSATAQVPDHRGAMLNFGAETGGAEEKRGTEVVIKVTGTNDVEEAPDTQGLGWATSKAIAALISKFGQKSCEDTPGWEAGIGDINCKNYEDGKWCVGRVVTEEYSYATGSDYNFPEDNCCACGKALTTGLSQFTLLGTLLPQQTYAKLVPTPTPTPAPPPKPWNYPKLPELPDWLEWPQLPIIVNVVLVTILVVAACALLIVYSPLWIPL